VETLQPDPRAALGFYRALFGWDAAGPGAMPGGGEYLVARLGGDDVAGIATLPPDDVAEPAWTTYVRVERLESALERITAAGGRIVVAPLAAPPAGRLAIVASPGGASLGLWEPRDRRGAQRVNAPGAWAMSTLRTRDLASATAYHAAALGWTVEPFAAGGAPAALFRLPGYVGGLAQQPVPRDVVAVAIEVAELDVDDHWSVDFWIDDVDAAATRVWQRGGTVLRDPFDDPLFRRAVIADPAGAIFTISQLVPERLAAISSAARTG
jgi:predicted enzyme related to lactoylglutathione lyase